ncbi:hypothetical protein [Pontibacter vulgaris]|uniref:hypothetical protein n=1 Tax=Pontibacter vulgaris TaxID=2905679 RepID=UPI001FA70DE4|nr:hypothetical protein [Pontibacter vulgaris]
MAVSKIARNTALGIGGYMAILSLARKWHLRWGATDDELKQPLPGDELMAYASATHAITINAPAEAVWPWLVQIGQNRAGFYSYTFLENLIAADIHNANRIVPEWQNLKVGDKVRLATGKVYGDFPLLPVVALEPYRHLVLKGWGAFVLKPINAHTTRLIIRSHGQPEESITKKALDFLIFEPIHFIMERRMLLGIKERAEREYQTVSGNMM